MILKKDDLVIHKKSDHSVVFKIFSINHSYWTNECSITVQPIFKSWSISFLTYGSNDLILATPEEISNCIARQMLD